MIIKPEDVDSIKLPFKVVTKLHNAEFEITKIGKIRGEQGIEISLYCNRFRHSPEEVELLKEPEYIPFTQEDWEQFAYELIKHDEYSAMFKIQSFDKTSILYIGHTGNPVTMSFTQLMLQCKFVKTNKPCGKLQA